MINALLAITIVLAAGTTSAPTDPVLLVQPGSSRIYANTDGQTQVDAIVIMRTATGATAYRVGVVGCAAGAGQIGRVGDDQKPSSTAVSWSSSGSQVRDTLAEAICTEAVFDSPWLRQLSRMI